MDKNKNINRLLFWFRDNDSQIYEYTVKFMPLAMLLNRLINENYTGKKIKFLNIYFNTPSTFDHFEKLELNYTHSYGGHVSHDSIFLRKEFDKKSIDEQKTQLWNLAMEVMVKISNDTKNPILKDCSLTAYKRGLEMNLREDFILLQEFTVFDKKKIKAELWAEFDEDNVSARFIIFCDGKKSFDKVIDKTKTDIEFFYEMFKKIIFNSKGQIVLKGHHELNYLPMKIDIEDIIKKTQPNTV